MSSFSLYRQLLFPIEECCPNNCLNERKFSWNSKSNRCWKFQLSILRNKKGFIPKKIWSVPCTMDSSFFSQKMPYYLLTLLVYVYGSAFRPLKAKYYETKEFLKSQTIAHVFFKVTFRGQISCNWISELIFKSCNSKSFLIDFWGRSSN